MSLLNREYPGIVVSWDVVNEAIDDGSHSLRKSVWYETVGDDYVERAEAYLYRKSLDILEIGVNVVLDWGFWTRRERMEARQFYAARGIACEFHYLDTDGEEWLRRLKKRISHGLAFWKQRAYTKSMPLSWQ